MRPFYFLRVKISNVKMLKIKSKKQLKKCCNNVIIKFKAMHFEAFFGNNFLGGVFKWQKLKRKI